MKRLSLLALLIVPLWAATPAPDGFIAISWWQNNINVYTASGDKWGVTLHPGCRFVIRPAADPRAMPSLLPSADPNWPGKKRTDEDCLKLYRGPKNQSGVIGVE